jgi:hypothetical protein
VSFDFRVVAAHLFQPSKRGSINTGTPFSVGGYFEEAA